MTNHPNRNWRRRMQQAADQWLATDGEKIAQALMPREWYAISENKALRERLRAAYVAGYQDGREGDAE